MKTNAQKYTEALALLEEIDRDWKEEEVIEYPASLPSFDELVSMMGSIRIGATGTAFKRGK